MTADQERAAVVRRPVINQHGDFVGWSECLLADLLHVEAFTDDSGTTWVPPTAWAYFAKCRAIERGGE